MSFYGGAITVTLIHDTDTDEIEAVDFQNDRGGRAVVHIGTVDGERRSIDLPAKARASLPIPRGRRPLKSMLSSINIDLPEWSEG